MKSLKSFLLLFASSLLFSTAIAFSLGTDLQTTAMAVTAINVSFYCLTYFNVIQLPKNVLGSFVGVPGMGAADGSPGIQVISTDRDRAIHLNNSLKSEFVGKNLVPGYLRLESVITNNNGTLKFPTYTGDSNLVYATEQRLNRNDAFIVADYGLFLLKQDVANKKTNGLPVSYPNITTFGAAAAADLMNIFTAGKLNVEIDKKRWLPDIDCLRFLQIPQVQQSGATNYDEWNLSKSLKHCTPQFVINGNGTNEIRVDFPVYNGFVGGTPVLAGNEHRAVLYLHGWYVADGNTKSSS
jgi:hypothetical protein